MEEKIKEEDKLIYAFMGGKWKAIEERYNSGGFCSIDKTFKSEFNCQKFCDKENRIRKPGYSLVPLPVPKGMDFALYYATSWDWLMPVVEKIEAFGIDVEIIRDQCSITGRGVEDDQYPWLDKVNPIWSEGVFTKITATYICVVEFIKFYNSNTVKP